MKHKANLQDLLHEKDDRIHQLEDELHKRDDTIHALNDRLLLKDQHLKLANDEIRRLRECYMRAEFEAKGYALEQEELGIIIAHINKELDEITEKLKDLDF